MTTIQRMALVSGIVFVLVSAAGFVLTGFAMPGMTHSLDNASMLFGVFPINVTHNAVHCAFGIWGLVASRSTSRSLVYGLGSGAAYLLLAILGLIAPTLFGLVPIGGWDILLHLILAVGLSGISGWWMMQGDAQDRAAERKAA